MWLKLRNGLKALRNLWDTRAPPHADANAKLQLIFGKKVQSFCTTVQR